MRKYILLPYQQYKAVEGSKREEQRETVRKGDPEIETNFQKLQITKDTQKESVSSEPTFNVDITNGLSKKPITVKRNTKIQSGKITKRKKIIIPSDNGAGKFWLRA